MSNVLQQITVDILAGINQKDPRWSEWSEVYSGKPGLFAFWDTRTNTQPSRNDIRQFAQTPTSGQAVTPERPGQIPSEQISSFTSLTPKKSTYLDFERDQVATLRVITRPVGANTRVVSGRKVIGKRVEPDNMVVEVTQPILSLTGVKTLLQSNSFLLQNTAEQFAEKFQISETFGDPVIFLFGKRQQIFQYGGILFDTGDWQWKEKFLDNYERFLRGTKAVENGAVVILTTNTAIIRGFLLQCGIMQSEATHGFVGFTFSMFVQDRIPIRPIEPSPEDNAAAMESDPQIAMIQLNDLSGDPNAVLKAFDHQAGIVRLPEGGPGQGFLAQDFRHNSALRIASTITQNGKPVIGQVTFPALSLTDPPQIVPDQDIPAPYLHTMIKAAIGTIQDQEQPALNILKATMSITPSITLQDTEANIIHHGTDSLEDATHGLYNAAQVLNLFNLGVRMKIIFTHIVAGGSVTRNLTAFKKYLDASNNIDATFKSLNGAKPIGTAIGITSQTAFEMWLDEAIKPSDFGIINRLEWKDSDSFLIDVFLKDAFVADDLVVAPSGPPGPMVYHVQTQRKLMRVGGADGGFLNGFPNQKHVLIDPAADFVTDLQPFFDAGDQVFATLGYAVIDENASTFTPTAKVRVYSIIDKNTLQLGLLTLPVLQFPQLKHQPIAQMEMPSYQIIVQRGTKITLIPIKIRQDVQSPPDGAFDNLNLDIAQLVQPKGVFPLVQGVHYTT